jgi:hypothetical protein
MQTELKLTAKESKTLAFYKAFYEENSIALLQYKSLRRHFSKMVADVLGHGYYNMGSDVYTCDKLTCEDITRKANRTIVQRIFGA